MPELFQDAVVTLAAAAAAWVVIRRVFRTVKPTGGSAACAACPSCATANPMTNIAKHADATVHPLVVTRAVAGPRHGS